MTADWERLPTLRLALDVRFGQAMALCERADELASDSRALSAEASVVCRRARQLRRGAHLRRASVEAIAAPRSAGPPR
jgi:hypothetical protein